MPLCIHLQLVPHPLFIHSRLHPCKKRKIQGIEAEVFSRGDRDLELSPDRLLIQTDWVSVLEGVRTIEQRGNQPEREREREIKRFHDLEMTQNISLSFSPSAIITEAALLTT